MLRVVKSSVLHLLILRYHLDSQVKMSGVYRQESGDWEEGYPLPRGSTILKLCGQMTSPKEMPVEIKLLKLCNFRSTIGSRASSKDMREWPRRQQEIQEGWCSETEVKKPCSRELCCVECYSEALWAATPGFRNMGVASALNMQVLRTAETKAGHSVLLDL